MKTVKEMAKVLNERYRLIGVNKTIVDTIMKTGVSPMKHLGQPIDSDGINTELYGLYQMALPGFEKLPQSLKDEFTKSAIKFTNDNFVTEVTSGGFTMIKATD